MSSHKELKINNFGDKYEQCGQARSFNPMGVNPIPARQASHRNGIHTHWKK